MCVWLVCEVCVLFVCVRVCRSCVSFVCVVGVSFVCVWPAHVVSLNWDSNFNLINVEISIFFFWLEFLISWKIGVGPRKVPANIETWKLNRQQIKKKYFSVDGSIIDRSKIYILILNLQQDVFLLARLFLGPTPILKTVLRQRIVLKC